jgi:hypothetical protein
MFYDSKMFKDTLLSFTFFRVHPSSWARPLRAALALPTLPGYDESGHMRAGRIVGRRSKVGRFLPPFPVQGLPTGRCIVN